MTGEGNCRGNSCWTKVLGASCQPSGCITLTLQLACGHHKLEALPSMVIRVFNARFLEILLDPQEVYSSGMNRAAWPSCMMQEQRILAQQASLGSILIRPLERP